jgi:Na+/H+-dicarboxylate symporter
MEFWKNYRSTLLLLAGIAAGAACGIAFGEGAAVVRPVGELFLNLVFVLIVPLVFFSMASAIARMKDGGKAGRVLGVSFAVFLAMSLVAALVGYGWWHLWDPLRGVDRETLLSGLPAMEETASLSAGEMLVRTFTVPDFLQLFNKANLLPLMVFSLLLGAAVPPGGKVARALDAGLDTVVRMMNLVMVAAPVGLCCYFAATVGHAGSGLIGGYLNVFLCYTVLAVLFFFLVNTAYMALAGRIKPFWRHILPPALTAVATSSSAAAMPLGIAAARNMGVREEVAGTVIPLGTNLHKDGTVIGATMKILFLTGIFGIHAPGQFFLVVGIALLAGMVMGAIPTGGMTAELLICSVFGFPPEMAAVIMVISTLIDIPATLLNTCGNVTAAALVDRFS